MCLPQDQDPSIFYIEPLQCTQHIFCALLDAFLAPVIRALPSLPSTISVLATDSGNLTLGGWPAGILWVMYKGDLSITMMHYSRFADEAKWNNVREALVDFQQRFVNDDEMWLVPRRSTVLSLSSGIVELVFHRQPGTHLSGKEVALVLKSIQDLFLKYNDKPREIQIIIRKNRQRMTSMDLAWRREPDPWPQNLPWKLNVDDDLVVEVYLYGINFDPSVFFDERFAYNLYEIEPQTRKERDEYRKPPRKTSYSFDVVRLDVVAPPNAVRVLLSAYDIERMLYYTRVRMFGGSGGKIYGPRELAAYIKDRGGRKLAKISLLYIDPDDRTAQA